MNQKNNNIRLLLSVVLMAVVIAFFFFREPGKNQATTKEIKPQPVLATDYILVENILDSEDSFSESFAGHLEKVCDYTKLPFRNILLKEWNNNPQTTPTTRVLTVQNSQKLSDSSIFSLLEFVSNGGTLLLPNFNFDNRMQSFWGLKEKDDYKLDTLSRGIFFTTDYLPNLKGKAIYSDFIDAGFERANFKDDIEIFASAINNRDYPVILSNKIGNGRVICFNTNMGWKKEDRGILFSAILTGLEGIPYPIANVSTIFIDDFPSPVYDSKIEPVASEFDLTIGQFVKDVWLPDMLKLADSLDIIYTAFPAFDYNGITTPPFLFDQWDANKTIIDGNSIITSDWISQQVIKNNHEMGFHGYNHVSLLESDWPNKEYMQLAMKAAQKKWRIVGLGSLPASYVPPTNLIDSVGMSQLYGVMPLIKYMSSLYLLNLNNGCNREFDPDPWNKNVFDYPRITSGYLLDDREQYSQQSLYLYTGIWTHFIHPDDVFQIPDNANETAGHFKLRNQYALGWHKGNNGKKGMLWEFSDYLKEIKSLFPLTRFVSVAKGGATTEKWRNTNYYYTTENNSHTVYSPDSEEGEPYFWFVYVSEDNMAEIEKNLTSQSVSFYKTPFLNGFLVSVKTLTPSLTINSLEKVTKTKTVKQNNFNNHKQLLTKLLEQSGRTDTESYHPVKPSDNADYRAWVDYYLQTNQVRKAAKMLQDKILDNKKLDTVLYNRYYQLMSWQSKEDRAWHLLDSVFYKSDKLSTLKYTRKLSKKYGYFSERESKKWMERQIEESEDEALLTAYYNAYNTRENKEKIYRVLKKLYKKYPNRKNYTNYLGFLINNKPKEALRMLNALVPGESPDIWDLATEISWLYANNNRFKKAYDWSKYSNKIDFVNKMYWLAEIKDYETLETVYGKHIDKNPDDYKAKAFMSSVLLGKKDIKEAWILATSLPESVEKDTLKSQLNKTVLYVKPKVQKDLIAEYDELFEESVKKQIVKNIRLAEGDIIEGKSEMVGDNNNSTYFENKLSYALRDKNKNIHNISVTHSNYYANAYVNKNLPDNVDKTLVGLEYEFKKPIEENKIQYFTRARVEMDKERTLYYQGGVGASLSKKKNFTSTSLTVAPVKTGPAYEKKIYRSQLSVYREDQIKNAVRTNLYAEGNYNSDEIVEGSITGKIILDSGKDKKFKVLPFVEGYFSKSNSDEVKDYPYFVVKERVFGGGGIGLKYGKEKSKFKISIEGSTFKDEGLGDFNRLKGSAGVKITDFMEFTTSGELSTQEKAYSNSIRFGLKYILK
ncbi:MAG: hypothetical protein CSA39_06840 [Flavobacteriales bacterium]|nr:MAG: hypothetical protein CSA39_06840 [Flavobacteriales bacterium]